MKKVLIVDDNMTNRELLKAIFAQKTDEKYDIIEADSGISALEIIKKNPPQIILLDVQMPEMNGYEVCQKLKADEEFKSIPILFITALTDTKEKVKGLQLGAGDYITKPINPEETLARVSTHLAIKQAEEDRIEKENLQSIRDMIATYNHNMNQPLMTAFTYLEILLTKFSDESDKTHQTVLKIKAQLDKVNAILKKIQEIETVQRMEYVEGSGMLDLGDLTSGKE